MPIFKTKNENFFKKWSSEMAYILGFFCADGSMTKNKRGAYFIEFQITDKNLLRKIRELFNSDHKISVRHGKNNCKPAYRLQIGSKVMFKDLLKLGLTPRKAKRFRMPKIPNKYFSDFARGYFDGDGSVWHGFQHIKKRKKPTKALLTRFTSGNKNFLAEFSAKLADKIRTSKNPSILFYSGAYRLCYSVRDSARLYRYLYQTKRTKLYLLRKKLIFEKFGPVA